MRKIINYLFIVVFVLVACQGGQPNGGLTENEDPLRAWLGIMSAASSETSLEEVSDEELDLWID